jgi:hypothetical protein
MSLAEKHNVNQQPAQIDRAHETINLTSWEAKIAAPGTLSSRKISQHGHKKNQNASIRKLGMTHSGNSTHWTHLYPRIGNMKHWIRQKAWHVESLSVMLMP